jgi:hypothetical protein
LAIALIVLGEGATEFDVLTTCDDTARQGALRLVQENGEPFPQIGKPVPRLAEIEDLLKRKGSKHPRQLAGRAAPPRAGRRGVEHLCLGFRT